MRMPTTLLLHEPVEAATLLSSASGPIDCFEFKRGPMAFRLHPQQVLPEGWSLLSLDVDMGSIHPVAARLSINQSTNLGNTDLQLPLHFSPGKRQRLLVQLPAHIKDIRLILSDSPGSVCIGPVRLRGLGRIEALLRVVWPGIPKPILSRSFLRFAWKTARHLLKTRSISQLEAMSQEFASSSSASGVPYAEWRHFWAESNDEARKALRQYLDTLNDPPKIAVLLPVFNTQVRWLTKCLDSVVQQSYHNWELCIADDASTNPEVRQFLQRYAATDQRIKVIFREKNGHICAASNSALQLATAPFVALLDHDDELAVDALGWIACAIANCPGVRLLYSDEDKISEGGEHFDPYFKPDFDRELLLGQNFVSHLGVYSTELLRELGGFREGYEGSQDHDLVLRASEVLADSEVLHIPTVLYHWRAISGSTAKAGEEKSYAADASLRAVSDHLDRTVPGARAELLRHGRMRIRYPLPQSLPEVCLIIPTRDRLDLLQPCVDSLISVTRYPRLRILVVDNGSAESATIAWMRRAAQQHPTVDVIRIDEPFNFSRLNNIAARHVESELIGLVNNDIEARDPDWLAEMVSLAVRPKVGAVGAMLEYPNGTIQHAGVILGIHGIAGHPYSGQPVGTPGQMGRLELTQSLSATTAACLLSRRTCFLEVGGLDESLAVAFNDVDYCLKLVESGYRILWTPHARLRHHESATRGLEDSPEKLSRFRSEASIMQLRWASRIANDPAYNPNLSIHGVPFTLDLQRPPAELSLLNGLATR